MDLFPDVPPAGDRDEFEEPPQQAWRGAPETCCLTWFRSS